MVRELIAEVPPAGAGRGVHRRPRVHRRAARRAAPARAAADGDRLPRREPTRRPVYTSSIKQDWNDTIRYECPAKLAPRQLDAARARGARELHGARLPRRRARRLAHGRRGADLLPRVQPAARARRRASRDLVLIAKARRHRLPHADRRDPRVRDPSLQGARAGAGARPARAGGGRARAARARRRRSGRRRPRRRSPAAPTRGPNGPEKPSGTSGEGAPPV